MKNLCVTLLLVFSLLATAWAQAPQLIVQSGNGKLYLEHTVVAGENWYSVGRVFNQNPKEIALFNQGSMSKPLSIGQLLKIPLTPVNFSQNGVKATTETLVPVYHIIQEREWMYHISTLYNKVPVESLEKWNHINKDQAKAGLPLIIGYLKVKTAESSLAQGETENQVSMVHTVPGKGEFKNTDSSMPDTPRQKKTEAGYKKPDVLSRQDAKPTTGSNTFPEKKQGNIYSTDHPTGGYFGTEYKEDGKITNGQAGTFKSTSGWQDGKYYALMNNVPVGRIIKVTSPSTNKNIYAKVLGQLPDMRESAGLTIRISNAAATELGTGEGKFAVEVRF
jgi:LysM repeat protein